VLALVRVEWFLFEAVGAEAGRRLCDANNQADRTAQQFQRNPEKHRQYDWLKSFQLFWVLMILL